MKAIRYLAPALVLTFITAGAVTAVRTRPSSQVEVQSTAATEHVPLKSDGDTTAPAVSVTAQTAPTTADGGVVAPGAPDVAPAANHAGQTPVSTQMVQRPSTEYLGLNENVCVYTFADGGTEEISLGVSGNTSNTQGISTNSVPVCPEWQ